jgi:hypothetical protein
LLLLSALTNYDSRFTTIYGTANAKRNVMKYLRERGIYLAPNGESFVASRERTSTADGQPIRSRLGRLSYFLFGRYEWAFHGMPDYEVATSGSLVGLKEVSNFRPDQLIDTGATAGAH